MRPILIKDSLPSNSQLCKVLNFGRTIGMSFGGSVCLLLRFLKTRSLRPSDRLSASVLGWFREEPREQVCPVAGLANHRQPLQPFVQVCPRFPGIDFGRLVRRRGVRRRRGFCLASSRGAQEGPQFVALPDGVGDCLASGTAGAGFGMPRVLVRP